MILHDKECIFVHIPKTGGMTVRGTITECRQGWEKANHENDMYPHIDIAHIRSIVEPEDFDGYFKFGFVRNPWDRAVSIFVNRRNRHGLESFEEFVEQYNYSSDFCKWPTRKRHQLDWFTDSQGRMAMDYVGRFETLQQDLAQICNRLAIAPPEHLIHAHKRDDHAKRHYSEYYTDKTREIIARKFRRDIEFFGYEFEQ